MHGTDEAGIVLTFARLEPFSAMLAAFVGLWGERPRGGGRGTEQGWRG